MTTDSAIVANIRQAQQGDQVAFGKLVSMYDQRLSTVICTIVHDKYAAEDLYQDVFVKVWKKLDTYQFRSDFYTWIYRIAMNTCYNYLKSESRKMLIDLVENDAVIDDPVLEVDDPACRLAVEAIRKLPIRQRTVVVMYYLEQNTISQISKVLSLSSGTVKKYLFRARKALRQRMEEHG